MNFCAKAYIVNGITATTVLEVFEMEEYYLMWLARMTIHNVQKAFLLLKHFQTAEALFFASEKEIRAVLKGSARWIDNLIAQRDAEQLEDWILELEEKEIFFYSYFHPLYPKLLKEIYDPPLGIYVKGILPDDEIDKIGVVGARRCSAYGLETAHRITKDLGKTNVVVVSGMAKGIDAMAHKGIMDGGGKTIAVLGCGVDVCYPVENERLMQQIIENGCVISEYPPQTKAMPYHFPQRNRIISGLCKMIVVVEAGKKSGTLITADLALENGRDVFVVPGNVTSRFSEGTNNLIKQGCPIITEYSDILFALGISYQKEETEKYYQTVLENLEPFEKEVFLLIDTQNPITAEEITRKLHRSIEEIQYILSLLEISGYIRKRKQAGYIRDTK